MIFDLAGRRAIPYYIYYRVGRFCMELLAVSLLFSELGFRIWVFGKREMGNGKRVLLLNRAIVKSLNRFVSMNNEHFFGRAATHCNSKHYV